MLGIYINQIFYVAQITILYESTQSCCQFSSFFPDVGSRRQIEPMEEGVSYWLETLLQRLAPSSGRKAESSLNICFLHIYNPSNS